MTNFMDKAILWCSVGATRDLLSNLKIKTRGFHMKTSNVSEIYEFNKKREARECDGARARVRRCDSEGEISLPRPRTRVLEPRVF